MGDTAVGEKVDSPSYIGLTISPDVASGLDALAAVLSQSVSANSGVTDVLNSEKADLQPFAESKSPESQPNHPSSMQDGITTNSLVSLQTQNPSGPVLNGGDIEIVVNGSTSSFVEYQSPNTPGGFEVGDVGVSEGQSLHPTNSRLSRSLLLNYYRIPSTSLSPSLHGTHTMLVEHYFRDVCTLYSSFDSSLNPFRTSIGRIWDSSPSIYYAIQSMAAAQLANTFPQMSATGLEMQRKAYECLNEELQLVNTGQARSERILLTILLLGLSTSWHDSSDLGLTHLTTARSLILPKLIEANPADDQEIQRQNQFFEESLIYWEMLIGFVSHESMTFSPNFSSRHKSSLHTPPTVSASTTPDGKFVPHPWTGIAPKVQMLFAEVGRLVRHERTSQLSGLLDPLDSAGMLSCSSALEEELLAAEFPPDDDLVDPGDANTSKHDFVVLAEAYRCAGLLELYRIFPALLRKRLGTDDPTCGFPSPRYETAHDATDVALWIDSLALHILDLLASLPASSGTCCLQPILLVTAASELRFVSSVDYFDIYANDARVMRARRFVDRRLNEFALRLPAKPLWRMLELIREVWRQLDTEKDVFWMDVMMRNGWQTVMG